MFIDHKIFVEDIMTILAEEDISNPAEIMDSIIRIVDDYKSELLLEKTEKETASAMATFEEEPSDEPEEDTSSFVVQRKVNNNSGQSNRAFLLEKAKQEYYRKHGITEEDEANFSILEKNEHRQKINELFYILMMNEEDKSTNNNLASTPFLSVGKVRRSSEDDTDDEDEIEHQGAVEAKWKKQQKRRLNRKINDIKGEIALLREQNAVPRISQAIISRNEDRIEDLEDELEDLEIKLSQY